MSWLFQAVPESRTPDSRLDEILRKHGLTREEMSLSFIRWIESIALETPDLYKILVSDPPEMKPLIRSWELTFNTGLTTDYAVRRNWNLFLALREFVQNALDIEDRLYGYENIKVNVWEDELGIHVADRGPGLPREAWLIGGSDKECWERGRFGEGLKMAAAELLTKGVTPYIFTINPKTHQPEVYKAVALPPENLVVVVWGTPNYKSPYSTEAILYKARLSKDIVEYMVFQEFLEKHPDIPIIATKEVAVSYCPKYRTITIVGEPDALWVGDIYVNRISEITGKPSLFGYNLWYVELDPNRITVSPTGLSELAERAAQAYTPEAIRLLLDKIVNLSKLITLRGYFETENVNWLRCDEEVAIEVEKIMKKHDLVWTDDPNKKAFISYIINKPVLYVASPALHGLFRHVETGEELAARISSKRRRQAEATTINLEQLNLKQRGILRACEIIVNEVSKYAWIKAPSIKVARELVRAKGMASEDTIYMEVDVLSFSDLAFGTVLHEFAHIYGRKTWGEAPDLSEAFEKALTRCSGYLTEALLREDVRCAVRRAAYYGVFGASPKRFPSRYVLEGLSTVTSSFLAARYIRETYGELDSYPPYVLVLKVTPDYISTAGKYRVTEEILEYTLTDPNSLAKLRKFLMDEANKILEAYMETPGAVRKGDLLVSFIFDPAEDKYTIHKTIEVTE